MKLSQLMLFTLILLINNGYSKVDSSFCKELEQVNLTSETTIEILSRIEKMTKDSRYQVFENCNIYLFAENIVKSENLSDLQKLEYYFRIQPLFPNNAEMGSVLGYDKIKLFLKHTKLPLKELVNSIKEEKLKKHIKSAFIDADVLEE